LNKEQVTTVLTSAVPTPASSGVENKQLKKKLEAIMAPLIPSQTNGIVGTTVGAIEPGQVQLPPMLDLLKRIASLEREMEVVRAHGTT